jgi:hypothetical protein
MKFAAKYCHSAMSSNLKCDEFHHDTDTLAAAALSGDLGAMLFRVKYANDATTYKALSQSWEALVETKSLMRRWPQHIAAKKVAAISLAHWLNDICLVCEGRGYEKHPSGQYLLDIPCKACKGTAKREIICSHTERDFVGDMVNDLDALIHSAAGRAMKKLSKAMDLNI